MNFLILSGSPKQSGLCASVIEEARRGAASVGAEVRLFPMHGVGRCHICNGGWGSCREEHTCHYGDDGFDPGQKAVREADAVCIITPVYWGEMSEGLKCFLDRLRRCEFGSEGALSGKQALLVASPGGSGGGVLTCLDQMDRFCRHTGAAIFDHIGINRWNSDYKRRAVYNAAKAIAEGRKAGTTI